MIVVNNHVTVVYTLVTMKTVIHIKADREIKENAQKAAQKEKLLDKVEDDIKHRRNLSPSFKNMDEAIDYLEKQW